MIRDRENAASWPDTTGTCCVVCGRYGANRHHMPPKGMAGEEHWEGCFISLCGSGTTGCHGLWHAKRLHLWFVDGCWHWMGENSHGIKTSQWVRCHDDEFWEALRNGLYG